MSFQSDINFIKWAEKFAPEVFSVALTSLPILRVLFMKWNFLKAGLLSRCLEVIVVVLLVLSRWMGVLSIVPSFIERHNCGFLVSMDLQDQTIPGSPIKLFGMWTYIFDSHTQMPFRAFLEWIVGNFSSRFRCSLFWVVEKYKFQDSKVFGRWTYVDLVEGWTIPFTPCLPGFWWS